MLEDLIIVGGALVGLYLLKKHLDVKAAAAAAAAGQGDTSIPTAMGISSAATTSAAYQTAPAGTGWVMGYGSPPSTGTVPAPPPVPQPPPPFYGGTVGSVGSGGNPLGGSLRAGVSAGTGTTVPFRATPVGVLPADTTLAGTRATLSAGHR